MMLFNDDNCGGSSISGIHLQNFTLGFCMTSTNCTYLYARMVKGETCCMCKMLSATRYLRSISQGTVLVIVPTL